VCLVSGHVFVFLGSDHVFVCLSSGHVFVCLESRVRRGRDHMVV
jgi:hypothetical protein